MVSSDKLSKLVALPTAIPALLVGLLLFTQWRSTACSFKEAAPGSGLLVCRQHLLGWELQTALVKVERREGWLWGRKQVGAIGSVGWTTDWQVASQPHARSHSVLAPQNMVRCSRLRCALNTCTLHSPHSITPQVDHWVLVDSGQADTLLFGGHASSLVRAVVRALAPARRGAPPGRLDAIVLTHAHAVGALPKLLHAYPDALVRGEHASRVASVSSLVSSVIWPPGLVHSHGDPGITLQQYLHL